MSSAKRDVGIGVSVVSSVASSTSKYVKSDRAAFIRVQRLLQGAVDTVERLEGALAEAASTVMAADDKQDAAVLSLASKLPADGFPRMNPFASFVTVSPSRMLLLGVAHEARVGIELAKKVVASSKAGAESKRAAEVVRSAAEEVLEAERQRREAEVRHRDAVANRDEVNADWRVALTNLRAAIRYADVREGTNEYDRVFKGLVKVGAKRAVQKTETPVS